MAPRQIIPGATYLVTRRCSQRQFLLLPSKTVNRVFLYCLAVAAARHGMKLHAACCLSNHYHIVVTDPHGKIAKFAHFLNAMVARALNCHYDRADGLFDSGAPSYVRLVDAADVLAKIVYTLTNPVAAGLVKKGVQWPGVHTRADQYGKIVKAKRPEFFFDAESKLPEVAELHLALPAGYEDWDRRRFVRELTAAVEEREQEIRAAFRAKGRRFLGVAGVRKQSPFGSPSSLRGFGKISPRVACRDKWRRIEVLGLLTAFLADYREAMAAYLAGDHDVVFPAGTYLMRLRHRVRCRRAGRVRVSPALA